MFTVFNCEVFACITALNTQTNIYKKQNWLKISTDRSPAYCLFNKKYHYNSSGKK